MREVALKEVVDEESSLSKEQRQATQERAMQLVEAGVEVKAETAQI